MVEMRESAVLLFLCRVETELELDPLSFIIISPTSDLLRLTKEYLGTGIAPQDLLHCGPLATIPYSCRVSIPRD